MSPVLVGAVGETSRRSEPAQREGGNAFGQVLSAAAGEQEAGGTGRTEREEVREPDGEVAAPPSTPGAARPDVEAGGEGRARSAARTAGGSMGGAPSSEARGGRGGAAGAVIVDGGRTAGSAAIASPGAVSAGGTLGGAPWFGLHAVGAEVRGQALAQAVQPALEASVQLADRGTRGATGTALGSAAEVQAMVDGETPVKVPDIVARVVQHSAAKGALAQAHRAQVNLQQTMVSSEPPLAGAVGVQPESAAADRAAPPSPAPDSGQQPSRPLTVSGGRASVVAVVTGEPAPGMGEPAPLGLGTEGQGPTGVTSVSASPAVSEAALAAGRPTEAQLGQVAVPDADHMELKVSDGEHSFRLSVAREADGLNVELKAPREIVADLRALEPDVEAALAEDGYELASFDASEDDAPGDREGGAGDGGRHGDGAGPGPDESTAAPVPAAPAGQGRIVNRLA